MKKIIFILSAVCVAGMVFGQGSLTPPGAPASTMKTLSELDVSIAGVSNAVSQVEARIDVLTLAAAGGAAHAIQQSGSYYLSGNLGLNADYTDGILINAENVTLDLNGFQIDRWAGSGGCGVLISAGVESVTVRNGTLRSFNYGIYSEGSNTTVKALLASECLSNGFHLAVVSLVEDCLAHHNAGAGIHVADGSLLRGCVVNHNDGYGIYAGDDCVLSQCVSASNLGGGIYVKDGSSLNGCAVRGNTGTGIRTGEASVLTACEALDMTGDGFDVGASSVLRDCVASENDGLGFDAGSSCQLSGCVARSNTGRGIDAEVCANLSDCVANNNHGDYGIFVGWGSRLSNCNASENRRYISGASGGISVGEGCFLMGCTANKNTNTASTVATSGIGIASGAASTLKNCTANDNQGHGISGYNDNRVVGNQCAGNGASSSGAGIYLSDGDNRLDGNHVQGNGYGIRVSSSGNFMVRNSASGNDTDYDSTGTQTIGLVYTGGLYVSPLSPWANFSY